MDGEAYIRVVIPAEYVTEGEAGMVLDMPLEYARGLGTVLVDAVDLRREQEEGEARLALAKLNPEIDFDWE